MHYQEQICFGLVIENYSLDALYSQLTKKGDEGCLYCFVFNYKNAADMSHFIM